MPRAVHAEKSSLNACVHFSSEAESVPSEVYTATGVRTVELSTGGSGGGGAPGGSVSSSKSTSESKAQRFE